MSVMPITADNPGKMSSTCWLVTEGGVPIRQANLTPDLTTENVPNISTLNSMHLTIVLLNRLEIFFNYLKLTVLAAHELLLKIMHLKWA